MYDCLCSKWPPLKEVRTCELRVQPIYPTLPPPPPKYAPTGWRMCWHTFRRRWWGTDRAGPGDMCPAALAGTCKRERLTGTRPDSSPFTFTCIAWKFVTSSLYAAVSGSLLSLEIGCPDRFPTFGKSHQKGRSPKGESVWAAWHAFGGWKKWAFFLP
jgi:hypothetical protein